MNAIFIWKRDCRMGYVRILATIRNIKTLTSCAWLPFRFPFRCWPQIRKNPQRNYYRTTLERERRVPEPCNPSMYNPWMYIHVKWGCQSLKAYKRVTFDSRDFLNVELENLFARRSYWQSHRKFCLLHCLPQKKIIKRRSIHLLGCFIKLSAYRLYLLTTKNPTATTATEKKKTTKNAFSKICRTSSSSQSSRVWGHHATSPLKRKKNTAAHTIYYRRYFKLLKRHCVTTQQLTITEMDSNNFSIYILQIHSWRESLTGTDCEMNRNTL